MQIPESPQAAQSAIGQTSPQAAQSAIGQRTSPASNRSVAGLFALIFAMLAFALAFFTDWGSYLNQPLPKPITEQVTDAASAAAGSVKDRVLGWFEEAQVAAPAVAAPEIDWNKRGKAASVLTAVFAILLASFAFVRREDDRMITVSLALAGSALAYQFVIKGLIALLAGLVIARVLGRFSRR